MKAIWLFRENILRYKVRLVVLGIIVFAGAAMEGVNLSLFYPLMEYVQQGGDFFQDKKFNYLIILMDTLYLPHSVGYFIILLFIVITISLLLTVATQVYSFKVYSLIAKEIRDDSFNKVVHAPMSYFLRITSGQLVSMIYNEAEYVANSLNFLTGLIVNIVFLVIYGVAAFYISWELTLLVVSIAFVRYCISGYFIRKIRLLGQQYAEIVAAMNSYLISVYQGIDIVKTFVMEKSEVIRLQEKTAAFRNNAVALGCSKSYSRFSEEFAGLFLVCLLIYLALVKMQIPPASLLILLFIIFRIIPKVTGINDCRIRIADYSGKIVYLKDIMQQDQFGLSERGTVRKDCFEDSIIFENVSFRYPDNDKAAVCNVNIKLKKNQTVAIVGESGSGKTTFARLLLKLYEPSSGKISIDGVDLLDFSSESRKTLLSVVNQDTFIFDDTVENNIVYGSEGCSYKLFEEALRNAQAEEFVNQLPLREKELIGERGIKLSGGQRQRISIARAFLRNTPILVLDEATSALDSVTEGRIQEALDRLSKNRTLVVIAHRLSTIQNADRIIIFSHGRIVEEGRHEELLARGGFYNAYYSQQNF